MKVYGSSGWQSAGSAVNGTSERYKYTSTSGQTTYSGNDDNGNALGYDAGFLDVYLSGIRLVNGVDFTATSGTSIQLSSGAATGDILEIVTYGTFTLSNQSLSDMQDVNTGGVSTNDLLAYNGTNFVPTSSPTLDGLTVNGNVVLGDNDKIRLGDSTDLEIYHDGSSTNFLSSATSNMEIKVQGGGNFKVGDQFGNHLFVVNDNGGVDLYHGTTPSIKLATSATGVTVTGEVVASSLDISGDVDIDGTTNLDAVDIDGAVDMASTLSVNEIDLKAISESKSFNANDIFVYDTSKDSDGGAWRKRTQNTSWYNEASSSTRSSRKEFPAVAVLAFNTNQQLEIYDADDPDLSLWARYANFTQDSGHIAKVKAKDGIISCCQRASTAGFSGNGFFQLNFVGDFFFSNISSTFSSYRQGQYNALKTGGFDFKLVGDRTTPKYVLNNYEINDIDVAVLPGAPINPETGLPEQTILLATDGGVNVIHHDGSVIRKGGGVYVSVAAHRDHYIAKGNGDDLTVHRWHDNDGTINYTKGERRYNGNPATQYHPHLYGNGGFVRSLGENTFLQGTGANVTLFSEAGIDGRTSLQANIKYDSNTGWQVGDALLTTLSDNDDTNVSGTSFVANGDFASGTSGWSAYNNTGTIANVGNRLQFTVGTPSGFLAGCIYTMTGLTVGKKYYYQADVETNGSSPSLRIQISGIGLRTSTGVTGTSNSIVKIYDSFIATATTHHVEVLDYSVDSGDVFYIDNISVVLAENDRSIIGNAVAINGSITKSPVQTGADLVAYSGFSSSNYLQQEYNADFQFGTGDFCITYWAKFSSVSSQGIYSTVGTGTSAGTEGIAANTAGAGTLGFAVYTAGIQASGRTNCGFNTTPALNQWHCIQNIRRGGNLELWIDGRLDSTVPNSDNINATDSFTRIGGWSNGSTGGSTSLALFRVSRTAPSPEQIKKVFEDEKTLFQQGAQATLYGTSNVGVQNAFYDAPDKLLYVASSQGTSVFRGLQRVTNTTTATTAGVGASNGLIAED